MSWKNHLQRKYCIAVAVTVFITVTATVWISRNYSFEVFNTTRATDLFIDSSRHNSYQCVGTDCTNHNNRQLKSERQPSPLISRYETKLSTIGNNSSVVLKNKKQKKVLNRWQRDQRYSDQENAIRRSEITWGEFVTLPVQSPRNRITIKTAILNSLNVCPASSTALNSDMPVCTNDVWSDNMVTDWRKRKVPDLCEENANSKIQCYDAALTGKPRFCMFENVMANFKKMRKVSKKDHITRQWEKGFLSADCGDFGKEDIGLPLYKPDIEGREDAICDYYFNETVIMYSHDNIRNFGTMVVDYLNVWAMLWVAGVSQEARDITFFNVDSIRKGKYFADSTNQFFRNYNVSFRRIAKAIDFSELSNPPAKVCFKKLLMQSRPTIPFSYSFSKQLETATAHSGKCVMPFLMTGYKSPILQRWNLHIRNNYELLSSEKMNTNREIVVSLIIRRPQGKVKDYVATRVINNIEELTNELNAFIATKNSVSNGPKIRLVVEDLLSLPFEEQVQLVGESSIIIGMNGGGMGTSIHMPVGTKYCCGMIEIFGRSSLDSSTDTISTAGFASKLVRGYGSMSKRLGINYAKLEIAESTSETGTVVPAKDLLQALESMLQTVLEKSSCFLPSVLKYPFM